MSWKVPSAAWSDGQPNDEAHGGPVRHMKFYSGNEYDIHAAAQDAASERAQLETQLQALRQQLPQAQDGTSRRAHIQLEEARLLLRMERQPQAWPPAREAFDRFIAERDWENAAGAAEALFLAEQDDSLAALGQGIWLAVTFPINPEVTVELLRRVVEETPEDSDGAAVAAAAAHYVADLRAPEDAKAREDLLFYTAQLLSSVARRHSDVTDQAQFDAWMSRLELDQPDKFLVRLRNVVDVLVQDEWWFDRDALQAEIPEA